MSRICKRSFANTQIKETRMDPYVCQPLLFMAGGVNVPQRSVRETRIHFFARWPEPNRYFFNSFLMEIGSPRQVKEQIYVKAIYIICICAYNILCIVISMN